MKKLKSLLSSYNKPTPAKFRKLGDALLSVSTMITGFAIYEDYKWIAFIALLTGSVGKFLTNFYADKDGNGIADINEGK
jgi:hypothetical protein